jgi:hypothetical protein
MELDDLQNPVAGNRMDTGPDAGSASPAQGLKGKR